MATHSSVLAWRIPGTGGAWWATVYGVTQSRTQLKQLSRNLASRTHGFLLVSGYNPLGFPGSSDGKESAYKAGDPGLIPGLGRSSGGGNGNPLQCSGLENPMDWGPVHGLTESSLVGSVGVPPRRALLWSSVPLSHSGWTLRHPGYSSLLLPPDLTGMVSKTPTPTSRYLLFF